MFTRYGQLTYCTNIHAGESWQDHFKALAANFPGIKEQVSPKAPMGIGLRLSDIASRELAVKEALQEFQQWLTANDAYVFTMNGFPFGGFHHTVVKENVHAPDWTTKERLEYTMRLFDILSTLLPEEMDGGVSTSPLSYRHWFPGPGEAAKAKQASTAQILMVAEQLISIHHTTGKLLHLDIEPEPDGLLENGTEFIDWFRNDLLATGIPYIATRCGVTKPEAAKLIKAHIRLCYDVCHFAIGYETHKDIIRQLDKFGINIGKIQISAALKALLPGNGDARQEISDAFSAFNETTYLHQVVARLTNGDLLRYRDLPPALEDVQHPSAEEWRAHFHVPVFKSDFGLLQSTQGDISQVLKIHKKKPMTRHLEVETYTWEVLAEDVRLPIQQSIIRELEWVLKEL